MTTGSGLYLNPVEKDPIKQNAVIRQLIEGRSNAVGIVTLRSIPNTTTVVVAPTCSKTSVVFIAPANADALATFWSGSGLALPYVDQTNVSNGEFKITHPVTSNNACQVWWVCLG